MPISTKGPAVLAVGVEVEGDIETGVDICRDLGQPTLRLPDVTRVHPHPPRAQVTLQAHALRRCHRSAG